MNDWSLVYNVNCLSGDFLRRTSFTEQWFYSFIYLFLSDRSIDQKRKRMTMIDQIRFVSFRFSLSSFSSRHSVSTEYQWSKQMVNLVCFVFIRFQLIIIVLIVKNSMAIIEIVFLTFLSLNRLTMLTKLRQHFQEISKVMHIDLHEVSVGKRKEKNLHLLRCNLYRNSSRNRVMSKFVWKVGNRLKLKTIDSLEKISVGQRINCVSVVVEIQLKVVENGQNQRVNTITSMLVGHPVLCVRTML